MDPTHPQRTRSGRTPTTWWGIGLAVCLALPAVSVFAGGIPEFYLIEPFIKKGVLVHFDTEANRQYELQFSTNALSSPPGTWTNVYVLPSLPFQNHAIVYHELTNGPTGFFRLIATP